MTRTFTPGGAAARRPAPTTGSPPSPGRSDSARALRRPSTTRDPRRSRRLHLLGCVAPRVMRRPAGPRPARARAPGSGRRSAASPARRGRRRRRGSARAHRGRNYSWLGSVDRRAPSESVDLMLLADRPSLGAQHHGHEVRARARLPAARVRDDPVLRGDVALLDASRTRASGRSGSSVATRSLVLVAALLIFVNQLCFVYGVDKTRAPRRSR